MGVQLDLLSWKPTPVDQGPKRRGKRKVAPKAAEPAPVEAPQASGGSTSFQQKAHAWFHRAAMGA